MATTNAMSDPVIRLLVPEDLDSALALSSTAGWNQRLDDWRMLLALAPGGSFAAVTEGRIAGTAIGIDYDGFAWIAMMLVDPAARTQPHPEAILVMIHARFQPRSRVSAQRYNCAVPRGPCGLSPCAPSPCMCRRYRASGLVTCS